MAALQIQCFLNESQMSALTNYVSDKIYSSDRSDIEDIDTCFDTMLIRLCVEFSIGLNNVELKQAEILDRYWNVIDADSAVLRERLRGIIESYNDNQNELDNTCLNYRNELQYELYTH